MEIKSLVIIPVYNEEKSVAAVVSRLKSLYAGDILLIDDGSTDNSARELEKLKDNHVSVICHQGNKGYGAVLQTGFAFVIEHKYTVAITMDCDEQHEAACVKSFLKKLVESGADVVSGSRYLKEFAVNDSAPSDRRSINQAITQKINEIFHFGITDTFCGFKAYRVEILKKLEAHEAGYAYPLQVWVQLGFMGCKITELAVPRIYKNLNRSFGEHLDNPEQRVRYYEDVLGQELQKWKQIA